MEKTMNKTIFVGEVRISEKGCIHQADMASLMGVERVTSIPKVIYTDLGMHGHDSVWAAWVEAPA
jgi:hypothetical protein